LAPIDPPPLVAFSGSSVWHALNAYKTLTWQDGDSGSMSFRARYEETGHLPARPLERRLSLWSTELRSSSPWKSPWAPYVSRHTMKTRRTSSGVRISTLSMKEDGNLLLKMHSTASHSNATKNSSCAAESSRWMIWCFDGCSLEKELTSSPFAGRVPSA
jgi:hypothetical protein